MAGQDGSTRPEIRIEYETKQVSFVSQFVVSGSDEQLILDLSAGLIKDPRSDELVLPIQTRLAMTPAGARRLIAMLERSLAQSAADSGTTETHSTARLPKFRGAGPAANS